MSQVTIYLPTEVEALARRQARKAHKTLSAYIAGVLAGNPKRSSPLFELAGSMPGFTVPDDSDLSPLDEP